MKIKQLIFIICISLIFLWLGTTNSNAMLYLNNLDFDVKINEDGSMDVTETWDIEVSETNTLYKTFNIDKRKYESIENFSVVEITNGKRKEFDRTSKWEYHITKGDFFGGINNDDKYEIAWGVDIYSTEMKKYEISYTVVGAIHKYKDCAELYWQFIGEDFEISAKRITGTIKLPNKVEDKEEIRVWGHTENLNGEIYATKKDTVEFELNEYNAGYFVEVRIATPTYVFENLKITSNIEKLDEIIAEEKEWAEEAKARRKRREFINKIIVIIMIIIAVVINIILIIKIKKKYKELKENPKKKPKQKLDYYRDLPDETAPPLEAVFVLEKGKTTKKFPKIFSAIMLNLALKKAIKMEQKDKDVAIEILDIEKENNIRMEREEVLVHRILNEASNNGKLTMKELEKTIEKKPRVFIDLQDKFLKLAEIKAENKAKFKKKLKRQSIGSLLDIIFFSFAFIGLIFICLMGCVTSVEIDSKPLLWATAVSSVIGFIMLSINILQIVMLIKRCNGFTQKGVDEGEKWKAFKKYMEDFSLLDIREVPHLELWEKYMVYATAFGVADKVLKQLRVRYPELNDGNISSNMVLFNSMRGPNGFNPNFISSINSSTTRMHSTSYSSTYSSGSGGGGGFSGGGGGGRRPVAEEVEDNSPKHKNM